MKNIYFFCNWLYISIKSLLWDVENILPARGCRNHAIWKNCAILPTLVYTEKLHQKGCYNFTGWLKWPPTGNDIASKLSLLVGSAGFLKKITTIRKGKKSRHSWEKDVQDMVLAYIISLESNWWNSIVVTKNLNPWGLWQRRKPSHP